MGYKSDQVPKPVSSSTATDSQISRPINSSTPPPSLSSAAIIGIVIGVLVLCVPFCAIATFSIRRRIRKNSAKPSIIYGELPDTQPLSMLPASIKPTEVLDPHKHRSELPDTQPLSVLPASIKPTELLDPHKDRSELPSC